MKKNIAIFQTDLGIGGIQKSIINLLNNLDYKKYNVDLYLLSKGEFFENLPKEVNVVMLRYNKLCKFLPFIIMNLLTFKYIKKEYDAVIDFNGYSNYLSSLVLKTKSKNKIMWVHNDYKEKKKYDKNFNLFYIFSKNKYKKFDNIVAVSEGAASSFEEITHIPCKYIIPNYIDIEEINRKKEENVEFYVDEECVNICFLGRLVSQKGLESMLIKFRNILNNFKDFHLYIIGDGPLKDKLISEVEEANMYNYVTFLGNKKNPFPYLKKCDYLILNSKYEGQGMVALEALALGLEVIMPSRLNKYLDIDYIDIDNIKTLKKVKRKENKLTNYNKEINRKISSLLGGE